MPRRGRLLLPATACEHVTQPSLWPQVRKLEFLLADAVAQGCDTVITVGGYQSNHARSTAACARLLGLEPHIVLVFRSEELRDDFLEKPHLEGDGASRRSHHAHADTRNSLIGVAAGRAPSARPELSLLRA